MMVKVINAKAKTKSPTAEVKVGSGGERFSLRAIRTK